jgi:virginiamycin A acetyltransferase
MLNRCKTFISKIFRQPQQPEDKFAEYRERDIFIHPDSFLGSNTTIGTGTNINGAAYIASSKNAPVTIGKYCAIAHNFRIRPRNHYTGYINLQDKFQNRYNFPHLDSIKGPVSIGNNVWIADNVLILSGVTIGDGAVIGAGSVVTKDIPPYCIAVGNPAKVIKKRFCESVIEQLIEIKWWDWSDAKIQRNRHIFEIDLNKNQDINLLKTIIE